MKRKLILGMAVLIAAVLVPLLSIRFLAPSGSEVGEPEVDGPEVRSISTRVISPEVARDPDMALEYGILGYLEIICPPDYPKSLTLHRGEEANLMLLLQFISHTPEVTQARIKIDPVGSSFRCGRCYNIKDAQGNIIEEGTIWTNDLVSYSPSGIMMIKAGETLAVTMTISIPEDLPEIAPLPLRAVGIEIEPSGDPSIYVIDNFGLSDIEIARDS